MLGAMQLFHRDRVAVLCFDDALLAACGASVDDTEGLVNIPLMAREVESRFGAPLLEIYGSTETGQMASRRTAREEQWRLWPGVRLTVTDIARHPETGKARRFIPLSNGHCA